MTSASGLILMRAVMGAGAAFIMPISLAVLPTIFSELERPRAIAIGGAAMFLGLPFGPFVAAFLLNHYAWGSIFLINGPVVVVALVGVGLFIPENRDPNPPRLDLVGALLAIAGIAGLVYGAIEQPSRGWSDPTVAGAMVSGAALIAAFVLWELRARSPMVDLHLFANSRFSWAIVVSVVMSFTLMGILFVFTPFLQFVQGNDAQGTAMRLVPLILGIVAGAGVSDRVVRRLGARAALCLGLVICAAGMTLMSVVGAGSGFGVLALALPVVGIGDALALFTSINVVLDELPQSKFATGTALSRSLAQVGGSLGVAVLGSILNSVYRASLSEWLTGLPAWIVEAAERSLAGAEFAAFTMPSANGTAFISVARDAYTTGMSDVLRLCAVIMIVAALLVGRFMQGPNSAYDLRREPSASRPDAHAAAQ
jgi:MFS family permease